MFWNQLVVLHREEDRDFLDDRRLSEMRHKVAERLDAMASAVTGRTAFESTAAAQLVDPQVIASPRYGDYVHNSTARFEELQALVVELNEQPV
jgi:multidrug resistance protein MdtO